MKVLGMYLPYVKRYFYFIYIFFYESINSDSVVFQNDSFAEIKDHSWRTTPFQEKKKISESFGFVSTLRKKVFSGAPVICVFLYGSNKSDSVVFGNASLVEIKDHSLSMTPFQKRNLL